MSDQPVEETEAPSDYDELVNVLLPVATEALEESGHFSPVAAFVQTDGQLCNMAVEFDDGEPQPIEIVEALQDGLREQIASENDIRATGICSIVTVSLEADDPTDAILVNLEQLDGDPLNVFLPYTKTDDGYDFGELVAGIGDAVIFAS